MSATPDGPTPGGSRRRSWSTGRLEHLLGLDAPIVQGPFGGGLSSVALAAAVANAGGLGSYGAHVLTPDEIGVLVADLKAATARMFAVNLWVPQPGEPAGPSPADASAHLARTHRIRTELGLPEPDASYPQLPNYDDQVEALLAAEPPVVSFVMGIPSDQVIAQARCRGIVTVATATTVDEAVAIEEAGVDVVVASGSDAGGHRGAFLRPIRESLVGTFSLIPQIRDAVRVPVVAAGGIADGRGVAAALLLGADGVQIGTAFLATTESGASATHRDALHSPAARTTVLTRLFTGRTARGIANRLVRDLAAFEDEVPAYPAQHLLMGPIRRTAADRDVPDHLNLWSGQAAALTRRARTAHDFVDELLGDTDRIFADHSRGRPDRLSTHRPAPDERTPPVLGAASSDPPAR